MAHFAILTAAWHVFPKREKSYGLVCRGRKGAGRARFFRNRLRYFLVLSTYIYARRQPRKFRLVSEAII